MAGEAAESMGGQVDGPPSGVRARQSWRPPALVLASSLLASVAHRAGPPLPNPARLSGWYARLATRVRPWPDWSPPTLALRVAESPLAGPPPSRAAASRASDGNAAAATSGPPPPAPARPVAGRMLRRDSAGALSPHSPSRLQPTAAASQSPAARQQPGAQSALSRPALRLATLRPAQPAHAPEARRRGEPAAGLAMPLPVPSAPTVQPRLILSISQTPRQDVRGGFPSRQPALPRHPERRSAEPATAPSPPWTPRPETNSASAPAPAPAWPGPPSETRSVIEQLIERTVFPTPLPGLELRLVSPEQAVREGGSPADGSAGSLQSTDRPTPPAVSAPPAQLDIDAVADRVYQTLQRRQQLERDRRGLY